MTDNRDNEAARARLFETTPAEDHSADPDNVKTRAHFDATGHSTQGTPAMLGDYRILRKIGEGGMGVVYEAEQQNPHRLVALKVIRGGLHADDYHIKMFEREIEALARLKHPGIASIYESGRTDDGTVFFAMELVNGIPLDHFVEQRRSMSGDGMPDHREQLRLFAGISEVVSHAHQRGVIHRDLKPQNILVTEDGTLPSLSGDRAGVKILDFGLARINDPDFRGNTGVSQIGQIKGTLLYMSPEQVRGRPGEIDVRSDVYSLGVMLFEMLTGRVPYDIEHASLPEAMRMICEEPPMRPSVALSQTFGTGKRSGRIDIDVETIVLKALEKDADRRYQSVAAMLDDVERYLRSEPIQARPPSPIYQFRKLVERHKMAFAALATIFLLIAGFGVVMAAQSVRIANERDRAEEARDEADRQRTEAETARNEALTARNEEARQREIAEDNLSRAETEQKRAEDALKNAKEQKQVAQRAQLAESQQRQVAVQNLETAKTEKRRAEDQTKIAREQKTLADNQAEEFRRLLYASKMQQAQQAWDQADTPGLLELLKSQIPNTDQKDLRGFEWYHFWRQAHLDRWTVKVPLSEQQAMLQGGFTRDGRTVFANAFEGEGTTASPTRLKTVLMDSETGRILKQLEKRHVVCSTSDGRRHVSYSEEGMLELIDDAGAVVANSLSVKMGVGSLSSSVCSPDGKYLVVVASAGTLELVEIATGAIRTLVRNTGLVKVNPVLRVPIRFSADSASVIVPNGREIRAFDLVTGKESTLISDPNVEFNAIALSADGKFLASVTPAMAVKLWDLELKKELVTIRSANEARSEGFSYPNIEFSPDGSILAVATGRKVGLFLARTAYELYSVRPSSEMIMRLGFSPDGRSLMTGDFRSTSLWDIPPAHPTLLADQVGSAFSTDGTILATTSSLGTKLWNADTLEHLALLEKKPESNAIGFAKFSPDGRLLAGLSTLIIQAESMGGIPVGGRGVEIWDLRSRKSLGSIPADGVTDIFWSFDSSMIATMAFSHPVQVWDVGTRQPVWSYKYTAGGGGAGITAIAFAPMSNVLAISRGNAIELIDIASGSTIDRLSPPGLARVFSIAFSPNGKQISLATIREVRVLDVASKTQVGSLKGHANLVMRVAYSSDGKRLASVGSEGLVQLWDTHTWQKLMTLKAVAGLPVAFSPNGRTITATVGQGVHIWRGSTDEEVARQRSDVSNKK